MGRHPSRRHLTPGEAPIGRRIRRRRRELGITQADLAGPEYTKSFISQLESGYADPSLDTLRFLGRRLHLSLSGMAGDVVDQQVAVLDGLLAWAHERRAAGDREDAHRALDMIRQMAPAANSAAADRAAHVVEAHLLAAEIALDDARADEAGRATDAIRDVTVGPHLECWRAIVEGRIALRRDDAGTALTQFKTAAEHTRSATRFPDLAVRAAVGVAAASAVQGALKQAHRRFTGAAATADRHGLALLRGRILLRLAWLAHQTGDDALATANAHAGAALVSAGANHSGDVEAGRILARLAADREPVKSPDWPIDPSI